MYWPWWLIRLLLWTDSCWESTACPSTYSSMSLFHSFIYCHFYATTGVDHIMAMSLCLCLYVSVCLKSCRRTKIGAYGIISVPQFLVKGMKGEGHWFSKTSLNWQQYYFAFETISVLYGITQCYLPPDTGEHALP